MLGKLFKYEIKATARTFLPLFAVLLLFTIINKIFFILRPNEFSLPQGITMMLYVFTLVGIAVATLLITIQRFYKNLLGDEGYLMFTLPVKPWQLITSKLLASCVWNVVSGIVAVLSVLVMALGINDLRVFPEAWQHTMENMRLALGTSPFGFFAELTVLILAAVISGIACIYLAIALGHQFPHKKLLASFGAVLVVSTAIQLITTLGIRLLAFLLHNTRIFAWMDALNAASFMHLGMWAAILYEAAIIAACFLLTNHLLSRRLNLE